MTREDKIINPDHEIFNMTGLDHYINKHGDGHLKTKTLAQSFKKYRRRHIRELMKELGIDN